MKVIISENAGFCFGVERAMKLTAGTLKDNAGVRIATYGPLIHNPQVVAQLEEKGVHVIQKTDAEFHTDILIMPSHGAPREIYAKCKEKDIRVVDATCPFVKDVHNKVREFIRQNMCVVIIGDANHTEIKGVVSWADNQCVVIGSESDIDKYDFSDKDVGIVSQTTNSEEYFANLADRIVKKAKSAVVQNTICSATRNRQDSVIALARETDAMVVIGGKNSANTKRLYQLCREANPNTYHIETSGELKSEWFDSSHTVALTAGASTPAWIISEVAARLSEM